MNDIQLSDRPAAGMAPLHAVLTENPGTDLEMAARTYGVSLQNVFENLPEKYCAMVPAKYAETVMHDMAGWGPVTLQVHTGEVILEYRGDLPDGKLGRGFYNLTPGMALGGHLRLDRCAAIAFLHRPFIGSEIYSVNFFNHAGAIMFRVFVGHDAKRQPIASQVEHFRALQARVM